MNRNKKKTTVLSIFTPLIFILIEVIRTFIRPVYGKSEYGTISTILGWLPNFLAAFGIISLGILILMVLMYAEDTNKKHFSKKQQLIVLIITSAIALIGLLAHEVTQKGTGLYYDTNDVYATIAGCLAGFIFYYYTIIKSKDNS
ncbi:MAG TPA: hypothetical protein PKE30_17990 [Niabella sp.]|nr:hypothetical protein [Niabella sp.]